MLNRLIALSLFVSLIGAPQTAHAQRDLKVIPPPDPELERETFILPEGFEVNLFAADPAIAKPIQMNFDPQGRLWIASSEVYPQIKPGQEATDRILVLEDLDGDGVSDKTHVFTEGLLIPTGVAPGDGGCYVGASTELLHFRDNDGDLKADEERVVLSGFGTEDTHHILHTLRWGPAQLLYFSQSIYIHSHIETPWGVRRLNAGGIWQFRPENLQLQVFARGLVNSWGTAFDDYGTTFATDGAGGEGINYIVPGASYLTAFAAPRILHGLNPGSPKHCGLEIVGGRHLPEDWQGSFITNDFRGHRVCRFVLTEQGSGFYSQEQQEVIKSDHVAFRPVDVKLGPDGAIYIADWYNPIIQHGEVDFRDPRRDHTHGRIWRVTYTGNETLDRPDLVNMETPELLDQLRSPEPWTRRQAKRVLKERGPVILPDLKAWAHRLDNTQYDDHRHRLEALWMYQALDVVEPELLYSLLNCSTADARAAAVRVIGHWQDRLDNPLGLLETAVSDEHPRVRLEAVRVLGEIARPESVEIAMQALDAEVDEWLDYSLWLTARDLAPVWQPALQDGQIDFGGNARHLAFALKSAGSTAAVPSLTRLLVAGEVSDADLPGVLDVIGEFGSPDDLRIVFEQALSAAEQSPGISAACLQSLLNAHARRSVTPAGDLTPLSTAIDSQHPNVSSAAVRLAGAWRIADLWPKVVAIAEDAQTNGSRPAAAMQAIAAYGSDEAADLLQTIAESDRPPPVRQAAIVNLIAIRPQAAAAAAVNFVESLQRGEGAEPLFRAFLARQDGANRLTAALADKTIPEDVAVIALRTVTASGQQFPELVAALTAAGNITSGPRKLSAEEMQAMVESVQSSGDPARGEAVFRRAELACFKCHAIGNAGGVVGPNLVSLGATAQLDYLIDSILDPNKAVKENYHTVVVLTDEGQVFSGIKVRQSDTDLILRDAEDKEIAVPLNQIEEQSPGVSLMPTGVVDKLTQQELSDLIAFLSALGRLPEYTIGQNQVARRWDVLLPTDQTVFRLRRTSYATAASDHPDLAWQRLYSRVSGDVPLAELPEIRIPGRVPPDSRGMSFLRCEIEAAGANNARLLLNSPDGLSAWLDEQPFELAAETEIPLAPGRHRLTIEIDRSQRTDDLRVELNTPAGAPAVQFVGGK